MRTLLVLAVLGMLIIPMEAQATIAVDDDVGITSQVDLLEASAIIGHQEEGQQASIDDAKILGASPATESPPGRDQAQANFYLMSQQTATIRAGASEGLDLDHVSDQGGVQLTRCIIRRTALA